jgi:hypothetical protein
MGKVAPMNVLRKLLSLSAIGLKKRPLNNGVERSITSY